MRKTSRLVRSVKLVLKRNARFPAIVKKLISNKDSPRYLSDPDPQNAEWFSDKLEFLRFDAQCMAALDWVPFTSDKAEKVHKYVIDYWNAEAKRIDLGLEFTDDGLLKELRPGAGWHAVQTLFYCSFLGWYLTGYLRSRLWPAGDEQDFRSDAKKAWRARLRQTTRGKDWLAASLLRDAGLEAQRLERDAYRRRLSVLGKLLGELTDCGIVPTSWPHEYHGNAGGGRWIPIAQPARSRAKQATGLRDMDRQASRAEKDQFLADMGVKLPRR
jgi:hypothetical protein